MKKGLRQTIFEKYYSGNSRDKAPNFFQRHKKLFKILIWIAVICGFIGMFFYFLGQSGGNDNSDFKKVEKAIAELNQTVVESELVNNYLTDEDYNSFATKAKAAGINIFSAGNSLTNDYSHVNATSNLTLTIKELGSFVSAQLKLNENDAENILNILQFEVENGVLTFILKYDFTLLLQELGEEDLFPRFLYITTSCNYTIQTGKINFTNVKSHFNQVSNEANETLLNFFSSNGTNFSITLSNEVKNAINTFSENCGIKLASFEPDVEFIMN